MASNAVFDTPKPTRLLRRILQIATSPSDDDVVLDFFAGTGSTMDAVLRENTDDQGRRRCVLVQFPEPIPDGNRATRSIAELTKERLRRAVARIRDENPTVAGDLGFRVFKLDTSNIRPWEPDRHDLDKSLLEHVEHLEHDRSEDDILYELLLKLGLDLCVPIETRAIVGKSVRSVGAGTLIACLAEEIDRQDVEPLAVGIAEWRAELAPAGETTVIFRDSAFTDDVAKTNLMAILEQHGLGKVRSL